MNYPFVLFYRFDKYSSVDNFLNDNKEELNCTISVINDSKELNLLFNPNYQILVTYGDTEEEYHSHVCPSIAARVSSRWFHMKEIYSVESLNRAVNYCFIHNCTLPRERVRPIFSIFTTCYNSYQKILRAHQSLCNQTHNDWEWVILDDSPDDLHFQFLTDVFGNDERIRMYKRSKNSGNIGNVKNEAVSLCRGSFVLELDHDDEILPDVLKDATDFFNANPEVGFIYMDFINIYENGNNFSYGDFLCKGYGSYYCQKYNNKWVYVYNTPNINNITLSHLVCCPNHPRIWRRETLLKAGNYSEFLPICDDYEILLRTALTTKMAKICKLGYVQYMNENNNNFSLIRNKEINRIGPQFIMPIFYDKFDIHNEMKKQNAYEDEYYVSNHSKLWERNPDTYTHKYANIIYNPDYDLQICIVGITSLLQNIPYIHELYTKGRVDFIILENYYDIDYVASTINNLGYDKMKCYSLQNTSRQNLIQYFLLNYKSCEKYEIISSAEEKRIETVKYNTEYDARHEIINSLTTPDEKYLEIGVEYGITFKNTHFTDKIGVDPDPKFTMDDDSLRLVTSDDFFENNTEQFDVIFIDGMHQVEYFYKDLNHSIQCIKETGKIFIDDILPKSYYEQLKIPNKHYYEKNILKYGEPWTGDVWKVLFFILKHHADDFNITYYNNENYRGVGLLTIKQSFEISQDSLEEINGYDYYNDFNTYIKLLLDASPSPKPTTIPIHVYGVGLKIINNNAEDNTDYNKDEDEDDIGDIDDEDEDSTTNKSFEFTITEKK
jgi:glycosyltransferase involved in cell wall biosynthesis